MAIPYVMNRLERKAEKRGEPTTREKEIKDAGEERDGTVNRSTLNSRYGKAATS